MTVDQDNPFSQRAFVAGSLVGVRGWRVDQDGTITGVFIQVPWHPGLNDAFCAIGRMVRGSMLIAGFAGRHLPKPGQHDVAALDCHCGFYAFFDADYHAEAIEHEYLTGLIRGTGVATVGGKGFRVAHAEILAFIEPRANRPQPSPQQISDEDDAAGSSRWDKFSHWLYHHSKSALGASLALFASSVAVALFVPSPWGWAWVLPWTAGFAMQRAIFHGRKVHRAALGTALGKAVSQMLGEPQPHFITDEQVAAVKARYSGVPWFASLDEAVAAFPLSEPPPPPPNENLRGIEMPKGDASS